MARSCFSRYPYGLRCITQCTSFCQIASNVAFIDCKHVGLLTRLPFPSRQLLPYGANRWDHTRQEHRSVQVNGQRNRAGHVPSSYHSKPTLQSLFVLQRLDNATLPPLASYPTGNTASYMSCYVFSTEDRANFRNHPLTGANHQESTTRYACIALSRKGDAH
jgi:hypothetical protein